LSLLKDAVNSNSVAGRLKGDTVKPVFRKTGNFNTKPKTA